MNLNRNWVTPLVFGAFILSAITGVLMFFHLDTGSNKFVHEWLSWALVIFVITHGILNFGSLKKYFFDRRGQIAIGIFLTILAISFVPLGESGPPPFITSVRVLAQAPLSSLAQIAKIPQEELFKRLQNEGFNPQSDSQSISDLVGPNTKKQMNTLHHILAKSAR